MKYDFDTIISRRGTNSYKWDTPEAVSYTHLTLPTKLEV